MKDINKREIRDGDHIVYSIDRSGLAFYVVTMARETNVQVQRLYLDKTAPDGFRRGSKISLGTSNSMMVIPPELLPIYANTPT
ncbi:hypothetical protein D3C76_78130 [compost metagenome]